MGPHCVLLLDEIGKAHPDLFNILLQVMDHGKLTDHNGKIVDFRNVILIMTTNAGAADLAKPAIGFGRDLRQGDDEEAINRLFTPELRNRLDAVIENVEKIRVGLLDLVEKQYAVGVLIDRVRQEPALVETHVARRRADEAADRMSFHVLRHIEACERDT